MKFRIPITFMVTVDVEVEGRNHEEACTAADTAPIPEMDWSAIDDSYEVNAEGSYQIQGLDGAWVWAGPAPTMGRTGRGI